MADQEPILAIAKHWLEVDKDPITRSEIEHFISANDEGELERRLRKRIAFGTAGLRSSMKAGFSHMNAVTVLQASQGLAQYILDQASVAAHDKGQLSVVIGYDARHNSEKFARLAAAALLAKGLRVMWFGQFVHTPMVPFAVRHCAATAGVMVTASHNPKNDNGYKVYWRNGCQIIPPHDKGIAECIIGELDILSWDDRRVDGDARVQDISIGAVKSYFEAIRKLVPPAGSPRQTTLPYTYTPMHGVGLPFMNTVAKQLGLDEGTMHVVQVQTEPDPEFPTVPFPNPEEKNALDLAMQEAKQNRSTLIIANDPDADRFAVAVRLETGEWKQLTGNQTGILLASYMFETYDGDRSKLAMLASTVSSRMLAAMSKAEGFVFRETLTGFKWLGNIAQDLKRKGYNPAFAFEEAIGYMFPSVVWDKDGIAAAAVFLTARRRWQSQGLTPWTKLQRLYERYGYFEDANTYLISPSPEATTQVFAEIRSRNGNAPPVAVGRRKVLRWRDLTVGYDTSSPDGKPDLPVDATAQMITCELEDEVVFTARGSGTEPKIKLYIEARGASSEAAKSVADEVLSDVLREWFNSLYDES